MGFGEAISTCFKKYVGFSGRARRSEYWFFALFYGILYVVGAIISAAAKTIAPEIIIILAMFLPLLAAGIRRLHDTGKSGWFILIGIIPIVGAIVLIVFYCQDSQPGDNQYGPNPKGIGGGQGYGGPAGYGPPAGYPPPPGY